MHAVNSVSPVRPSRAESTCAAASAGPERGRCASEVGPSARAVDRERVRAILEGESGAFEGLYEEFGPRIRGFAVKRLGDEVEAEDVVQDVFLEIHRSLSSWEGRSSLSTWIFGVAHHQVCRRFRKKTPYSGPTEVLEAIPADEARATVEDRIDAKRRVEVCARVLEGEVSPSQREIFDLHYGSRRPTRVIADALGKSNQAVKVSLHRTRSAMRLCLAEAEARSIA